MAYNYPNEDTEQKLQREVNQIKSSVGRLSARLTGGVPVYDDTTYSILIDDLPDGQVFIRDRSPDQLHWIANGTEYFITGTAA